MGLDGCGKCMKYTMIAANFLIMVGGFAVLSVGIWTCVDKSSFEKLIGSNLYMSAAYILIVTGIIVVIISVIGCLGALRDIKCLLITYFIILFILFVIMLVGGILGYVFRNEVREKMKNRMQVTLETDYLKPGIRDTWDTIQSELKCCGTNFSDSGNVEAWLKNGEFSPSKKVPLSCCVKKEDGTFVNRTKCVEYEGKPDKTYIHTQDCYYVTVAIVEDHALVVGGVGIGIACLLILGMVFSLVLFKVIE